MGEMLVESHCGEVYFSEFEACRLELDIGQYSVILTRVLNGSSLCSRVLYYWIVLWIG